MRSGHRGRYTRVGARRILRFSLALRLPRSLSNLMGSWLAFTRLKNAKNRRFFFLQANTDPTSSSDPCITPDINQVSFKLHFRSPVRLAYDNFDANAAGKDLPPLMILHGLFGSKRNFRELAKMFNKETGRQVNYYFVVALVMRCAL